MKIVELPNDAEETFITLYTEERFIASVASVWGVAKVSAMDNGEWHITITKNGSIVGFMYADAIRMK